MAFSLKKFTATEAFWDNMFAPQMSRHPTDIKKRLKTDVFSTDHPLNQSESTLHKLLKM